MPIDMEKVGDTAGRKGVVSFGEDVMKVELRDELLSYFDSLSDEKKKQVLELAKKIGKIESTLNKSQIAPGSGEVLPAGVLAAIRGENRGLAQSLKEVTPILIEGVSASQMIIEERAASK